MLLGLIALALALMACGRDAAEPSWAGPALQLIAERSSKAPRDQHGLLDRSYGLQDLDHDGIFEVLETIPHYEGRREFMNVELAPAFEWVSVFQYQEGAYREATQAFRSFLKGRRAHYELWLRLVQSPSSLSPDSQGLVRANRDEFLAILREYIRRIEKHLAERAG